MGSEKFKRPILASEGIQAGETTSPSTFSSPVTVAGKLTLSSGAAISSTLSVAKTLTASSNAVVSRRLTLSSGFRVPTETVTTTGGADTLSAVGVSFITYGSSSVAGDIIIPNPPYAGAVKHIFAQNNTTSIELNLNTHSSAGTFWGTTYNTVTIAAASTGSPGGTPAGTAYLGLIAASTDQWAIFPGSTFNWDFSGSTGSTDSTST